MADKKIPNVLASAIIIFALMTNVYSVLPGSFAGSDIWLSHIIATALAIVFAFFLTLVCDRFPSEAFYGVLEKASGKVGAKILAVLFFVITITTVTVSLTVFSRFVQQTALPLTPPYILPLLIAAVAAFAQHSRVRSITGSARFLAVFMGVVFLLFIIPGFFGVLPELFLPLFESADKILPAAGEIFLNRFLGLVPLLAIYTRMENTKTRKRYFLTSTALSGIAMTIISVVVVGSLGKSLSARDFYPAFTAMSSHGAFGFIRHTEVFASITMTVCLFFKCAVSLLFMSDMTEGVADIKNGERLALPYALILGALTQVIYSDVSKLRNLLEWKSAATVAVLGVVTLSVFLYILAKIRRKTT